MFFLQGAHGHKDHVKPKPGHKPVASAAAAGASKLAQALSDPPPPRPDGTQQRGGRHSSHGSRLVQQQLHSSGDKQSA